MQINEISPLASPIDRNLAEYVQERNLKAPRALIENHHIDAR
jgi:hypothetical protein